MNNTVNFREVTQKLDRCGIEWYLTSRNDSWNQIIARDNNKIDFSTWFEIEDGQVAFEDQEDKEDFFSWTEA